MLLFHCALAFAMMMVACSAETKKLVQENYQNYQDHTEDLNIFHAKLRAYVNRVNATLQSPSGFLGNVDNETDSNVRRAYNDARDRTNDFMTLTSYDRKLTGYNDAEYKKYQPIFTKEVLRFFEIVDHTVNEMVHPFGPQSCGLVPDELLKEEFVPRLTGTVSKLVEHLEGMLVEMENGTYKLGNSSSMGALRGVCVSFGNTNARNLGIELEKAVSVIGPGCDLHNNSAILRNELVSYASSKRLPGNDSNGCLPLFVARYTDSIEAVKMLKNAIAKYIYVGVHLQSFCVKVTAAQDKANRVAKQLQAVGRAFRYGLSMVEAVKNEGLLELVTEAKDAALAKFEIKGPKAWLERVEVHSKMAEEIYDNAVTKYSKGRFDGDAFQVLVSLLREKTKTDEHCQPVEDNSNVQGYNEKGVNYFVKYYRTANDNCANDLWTQIYAHESVIVNAVFSRKNENLCDTAKSKITEFVQTAFGGRCGFSAVAAVRCGYQFVWYQLGYRYFTVGRTAGTNYTLTSANEGRYNSNCGQIFLFR